MKRSPAKYNEADLLLGQVKSRDMVIDWRLTHYSDALQCYRLNDFVTVEEAARRYKALSPYYVPHSVSALAQRTSNGDADYISDYEAIRRYEHNEMAPRRAKLTDEEIEMVQDLGLAEDMYLPKSFGEYIARIRVRADFTQTAATRQLMLSHSILSRYETGEAFPTPYSICRLLPLADAANLDHDAIKREYLVACFGPEKGTVADILYRERRFKQMSSKQLAIASKISSVDVRIIEKEQSFSVYNLAPLKKMGAALNSERLTRLAEDMRRWPKE